MIRFLVGAVLALSATAALGDVVVTAPGGREFHTGLLKLPQIYRGLGASYVELADCEGLPADFDLRDLGVVGPIKNQGSCGSCWAFSKTASLESAIKAAGGAAVDLAEQELVSCDRNNYGCNGGNLNQTEYQVKTGQTLETAFPYTASDVRCKSGLEHPAKGLDFVRVRTVNAEQVKCALYKSHTIPWITVSAGGSRWSNPPTGDMSLWPATANNRSTNHAIGLVGWRTVNGKAYFIARNSWGTSWGSTGGRPGAERGYALMPLGADALGEEVAYIATSIMPCQPPKPILPVEVVVTAGMEVVLAVKPDSSATYKWYRGDMEIAGATSSSLVIKVDAANSELVYRVVATNSCGSGESRVRVKASVM